MSKYFALFLLTCLNAWALEYSKVNLSTVIQQENNEVWVTANSNSNYALICNGIDAVIEIGSKSTNSIFSNHYLNLDNVFIYPQFNNKNSAIEIFKNTMENIKEENKNNFLMVDNAKLDASKMSCRYATFNDYCNYAPMDAGEIHTINELKKKYNLESCLQVSSYLWPQRKVSVSNTTIYSYEFLSLIPKLKVLWVENAFSDISGSLEYYEKYISIYGKDTLRLSSESNKNTINNLTNFITKEFLLEAN